MDYLRNKKNDSQKIFSDFANEDNDECSESEELITIDANGIHLLDMGIKTGNSFEIKVDRDPARQGRDLRKQPTNTL